MSDEVDIAKAAGGLFGVVAAVGVLFRAFITKGEEAVKKVDVDREQQLIHCVASLDKHREQLELLKQKVVELDTRLGIREGRYGPDPLTNPGSRPTPAMEALRAKHGGENG